MNNSHSKGKVQVFFILIILLSLITIDSTWKFYLEISARTQAQYNLEQTRTCVNDILLTKGPTNPVYNPNITNDQIEKALKTCARNMRVSPTGDMFAFDMRTKEFIFDTSLDCFVEGGKFMTEESECKLHKDPQQCVKIMRIMNVGFNTDRDLQAWWKFDDAKEYLEWKILPSEDIGFDGIQRGGILKPRQVLVAQGVQEDEIRQRYLPFRIIVHSVAFFAIILVLLLARHCNDDK